MIAPSADGCKRVLCPWRPEANVDSPRFLDQDRSAHVDRLDGSLEQVSTRNEKIPSSQRRELFTREPVDDRSDSSPVHLPRTHRARFTAGVQDSTPDLIRREVSDCERDKIGFSVGCRIAIADYGIPCGENDLIVQNQKSAEGMVAVAASFAGEGNSLPDELLVVVLRWHDELKH